MLAMAFDIDLREAIAVADSRRWLPLSGIVFVVLALVAVIALSGDTPESTASGSEVATFYDDEQVRQAIAAFVFVASIPFLVLFASSIAAAVRGSGAPRVWEHLVVGGSLMTGAIIALLGAIIFAKTDGATNGAAPEALQALNVVDGNSWVAFNATLGVMMLGAAGCLVARTGGYRRLGWIALVLGIALFIPFADFIALILTLVWILVLSVMLFRDAPGTVAAPIETT
jgi:hypothetical protein